ncbi:MAG TPA: sigma-54 dependent transcriptional regulator [Verrucomicrobiae bacterium]|nr:sigma-54 dependent transcriptional regulator [Verrucomicrobiae bacterium]
MDLLIIDDDKTFRDATMLLVEAAGHYAEAVASGAEGLALLKQEKFEAVLLDVHLDGESGLDLFPRIQEQNPGLPVVFFTAEGNVRVAVEAMRRGAVDFLEKPFHRDQCLAVLTRLQRLRQMGQKIDRLEREVTESSTVAPKPVFEFESAGMREAMDVLMRAAKTPASIMILGESGTGKSIAARAVHRNSHLADKPFVTVNCPSLSKELLESELFGHARGAFTGAVKDHWGKVRAASGGTLFLDEIGDLAMEIQPKLLRLLQEREYERLGENVIHSANVRVIAATNRNLKERVAAGAFREDLFFRLNVITVEVPPLRRRPDDLDGLATHFLKHFAQQCGRKVDGFSSEAMRLIRRHSWPGNVRELCNVIERAVILARGNTILPDELPADLNGNSSINGVGPDEPKVGSLVSLEKLEEAHIRRVLEKTSRLTEASAILGIDQATLYRRRKKIGLGSHGGQSNASLDTATLDEADDDRNNGDHQ